MPTTKLTTRQRDKLIEAAQNAIGYNVEGKGAFPLDMLRYDLCWPATAGGAQQISRSIDGLSTDLRLERTIMIKGLKPPTVARWASFGWKVLEHD